MCIVDDFTIVDDDILPCHLPGCLGKNLLQHHSTDDTSDRQTSVHSWMKGVKLDIPAELKETQ